MTLCFQTSGRQNCEGLNFGINRPVCGHVFCSPRELLRWTKEQMQLLLKPASSVPGVTSAGGLVRSSSLPRKCHLHMSTLHVARQCASVPSWAEFLRNLLSFGMWPPSPDCLSPTPSSAHSSWVSGTYLTSACSIFLICRRGRGIAEPTPRGCEDSWTDACKVLQEHLPGEGSGGLAVAHVSYLSCWGCKHLWNERWFNIMS